MIKEYGMLGDTERRIQEDISGFHRFMKTGNPEQVAQVGAAINAAHGVVSASISRLTSADIDRGPDRGEVIDVIARAAGIAAWKMLEVSSGGNND